MNFDVAIIGGGIIGMMTAYELLDTALKIVIIDKGELGQEASSAGGGILSALPPWKQSKACLELQAWSQQHYPTLIQALEEQTGIVCDFTRSGMLAIDIECDNDFDSWSQSSQSKITLFDDLTNFPELLHLDLNSKAAWLPEVANVNNLKFIKSLKQALIQNSVEIIQHEAVEQLEQSSNKIVKLLCSKQEIIADKVVLAAGAWSSNKQFDIGKVVKPIRGQMISYTLDKPLLNKIILYNGKYCIPRSKQQLIIGSTLEDVGFDISTTTEAKAELQSFAEMVIPELKQYQPDMHWAGLRPHSDVPIITKHEEIDNLYINTGHFRYGVTNAPASARLLRNLLLNEPRVVEASYFT